MQIITLAQLNEYQRFSGDDDMWSRGQWQRLNSPEDWYLIRQLLQDIIIVHRGLAASAYTDKLDKDLQHYCDNAATIEELHRMAQVR